MRGCPVVANGCERYDANVGFGVFGGVEEGREEEFYQECVADVVGAKLDFVAVLGEGWGDRHYARVTH